MAETTEGYIRELIETKKRHAEVHRAIAKRALDRYKKHTHDQSVLEDEIMKLEQSLAERVLKKAG